MYSKFVRIVLLAAGYAHATTHKSPIKWINCSANVPETLQGSALPTLLPPTLQCGRLSVPTDYSKPMSTDNSIEVGFAMYRPQKPAGLINFNPGGPNQETASFAWIAAVNLTAFGGPFFVGLEGYDILAMDPRGSYQSNAINCTTNFSIPSSLPSNEAEYKALHAIVAAGAQSCITNTTPKGLIAHMGTTDTIQDWDSVRAALDYETMHYLGVSYGTYGGVAYANKFPQHVGRFVLDAILAHGMKNIDLVIDSIKAVNRLILRADAYCIYDSTCPFHSQGKGSIIKAFNTVIKNATLGAYAANGVSADDIRTVLNFEYFSNTPDFPDFNEALYAAFMGNASGFSYAELGPAYSASLLQSLPTLCLDLHVDDNTWTGFEGLRNGVQAFDTANIHITQYMAAFSLCGGWPYRTTSVKKIFINQPMVLVTADFDLNTPTESTTVQQELASKSVLVVRHGDDHGTFLNVMGQTLTTETDFLTTGKLPHAINDTSMTVYAPGCKRGAIEDPYTAPIGPTAGDITSSA